MGHSGDSGWLPIVHSNKPIWVALALLFALLAIGATAARAYKNYTDPGYLGVSFSQSGMFDFHCGGYWPATAFRNGVSPYSMEFTEKYPMRRPSPPYHPIVFMEHIPFSLLPVSQADVAYFIFTTGLLGLLAYWSFSMSGTKFAWAGWLLILGLFVTSRPGHMTLYTGYFTPLLVIGTVLALHYSKSMPWLSAIGMLLASGKPTYIIPLAIIMFCRKDFRALFMGLTLCTIFGLIGVFWLASFSSVSELMEGLKAAEAAHMSDEFEIPMNTWTRIDLVGAIAKTTGWDPSSKVCLALMLAILVMPCLAIWKSVGRESNGGGTGLTALIAMLALLVSIYHHSYDGLLVAVPWAAITFFGAKTLPEVSSKIRWLLSFLLAIPAINYGSTFKVKELLGMEHEDLVWKFVTSVNTVSLMASMLIVVVVAFRLPRKPDESEWHP